MRKLLLQNWFVALLMFIPFTGIISANWYVILLLGYIALFVWYFFAGVIVSKNRLKKEPLNVIRRSYATCSPTFVLTAKDRHSIEAIKRYRDTTRRDSQVDELFLRSLDHIIEEFEEFERENPDKMKTPD